MMKCSFFARDDQFDKLVELYFFDVVVLHDVNAESMEGFISDESRRDGITVDAGRFESLAGEVLSHNIAEEAFPGSAFRIQEKVNMGHRLFSFLKK